MFRQQKRSFPRHFAQQQPPQAQSVGRPDTMGFRRAISGRKIRSSNPTQRWAMTLNEVMFLFAGVFLLQLLSLWSASLLVSAESPVQVSTGPRALFQEVGHVYAECDFAHIFLELPIADLINRTDVVYSIFLDRMGKNNSDSKILWVPAWLEDQMQALLKHKAAQVFSLRDTVLAKFHQDSESVARAERDLSVNIDPVGMINAFFSGINNWIHASSIADLKQKLGGIAHEVTGIKAVERVFSANQVRLAEALADYINDTETIYETNHIDLLLWLSLDELQEALSAVVLASGDLARRHLPAWILPPAEATTALEKVNSFALKNEQQSALSSPMDLHSVPTTVVSDHNSWYIVLHVPLVSPRDALTAFTFTNAPFLLRNESVKFNGPSGLVGHSMDLWPDLKTVFIPENEVASTCLRYGERMVCPGIPVSRIPPCPVALLHERSDQCLLVPADSPFISVGTEGPTLIFTATPLEIACKCGDEVYFGVYQGPNIFNVSMGCRLESATFTLYIPKTVSSPDLEFRAMDIPADLLRTGSRTVSPGQRVAGLLATIRTLTPAVERLQNSTLSSPEDHWQAPEVVTMALSSAALLGVLVLAGICLYASRTAMATH